MLGKFHRHMILFLLGNINLQEKEKHFKEQISIAPTSFNRNFYCFYLSYLVHTHLSYSGHPQLKFFHLTLDDYQYFLHCFIVSISTTNKNFDFMLS